MKKNTNSFFYRDFKPSFWLKNRHIQTLFRTFVPFKDKVTFHCKVFNLSDGDFLDIYYNAALPIESADAIAVLFHGLAGSYTSSYIQGAINALEENNIAAVVMHYRSSSGRDNRYAQTYHGGKTDDALEFLEALKKEYPEKKLFCVGYSLGANMLLKLLGELAEKSFIDAAVAVSTPFDIAQLVNTLQKGFARIYQEYLLKELRESLIKKYEKHPMQRIIGVTKEEVKNIKSFWELDDIYTAKINGFSSAHDYYNRCSSKNFLKTIETPTLLIHAKDDPFMSGDVIPKAENLSQSITLAVFEHGGHVGFIEGSFIKPYYWLDSAISDYFKQYLSYSQHQKHS
jgi:predicted alpha/beta-fold hydrolase